MRLVSFYNEEKNVDLSHGCGLCLGHFDGVHIGHRALFDELKRLKHERGETLPLGVLLFSTPPTATLSKTPTPQLTTLEEKLQLIKEAGLDFAVLYDFPAIKDLSPEAFIDDVLLGECHAQLLVCGFNYSFGARGKGTPTDLINRFAKNGRAVSVMPPVQDGPYTVSSSLVRAMLQGGHPDDATRLLGRPYLLSGTVTDGRRLGRTMGLPTANLTFQSGMLVPMHGVYAVRVTADGTDYNGICNVGVRPTVNNGRDVNCETFIFDFSGDLYGKALTVRFLYFLREEQRFADLTELEAQIRRDIDRAKAYFA